jgi:hypothetical protein
MIILWDKKAKEKIRRLDNIDKYARIKAWHVK